VAGANKYVITGGPGLGKTALLASLQELGYAVYAEAARAIIDTWRRGGETFPSPWIAREAFDRDIENIMLSQYVNSDPARPAIYDRGLPDLIAWKRYLGHPVDDRLKAVVSSHPYAHTVFITPNWAPWYELSLDRPFPKKESFEINEILGKTYIEFGYHLLELPKGRVSDRAAFVDDHIVSFGLSRK
jgi:predicted ATPase